MTRYFYADPLAAAWMAKHFGMFFHDDCSAVSLSLKDAVLDEITSYKAVIHPDSLHLLEPRVGDVGANGEDTGIYRAAYKRERDDDQRMPEINRPAGFYTIRWESIGDAKIIQRDGVAFMWPESEAA